MIHLKLRTLSLFALMIIGSTAHSAVTTEVIGYSDKQCVECAREKVPSLPRGLYTLADKKTIINSHTCKKGRVAIMDVGPVGHVAYVAGCDSKGKTQGITLDYECNYLSGRITRRTSQVSGNIHKSEKELRILGYFKKP